MLTDGIVVPSYSLNVVFGNDFIYDINHHPLRYPEEHIFQNDTLI